MRENKNVMKALREREASNVLSRFVMGAKKLACIVCYSFLIFHAFPWLDGGENNGGVFLPTADASPAPGRSGRWCQPREFFTPDPGGGRGGDSGGGASVAGHTAAVVAIPPQCQKLSLRREKGFGDSGALALGHALANPYNQEEGEGVCLFFSSEYGAFEKFCW
jgi:hypothetical protein